MDKTASASEPGGLVNSPEPFLLQPGEVVTDGSAAVGSRQWCAEIARGRHSSVQQVVKYFAFAHLPARLQDVSGPFAYLAQTMLTFLPDSPELTVGLRKLIEAKDCAVRAMVDEVEADSSRA